MRFGILIICLLPSISWAEAWESIRCSPLNPKSCYEQAYESPRVYEFTKCHDNAFRLAKIMKNSGVDLSRAQIVYFSSSDPKGLIPSNPRSPPLGYGGWPMHVALVVDGKVYDFDYGAKPVVVPWVDYMKKQFKDQDVQYRSIPPDIYLNEFHVKDPTNPGRPEGKRPPEYFSEDPDRRFPLNTVRQAPAKIYNGDRVEKIQR